MFNDPKHKNLINDIAGILNEHNKTYYQNLLPEAVVDMIELCAEDIAEMEIGHRTAENIGEVMKEYFYEGTRHARIKPTNEMSAEFYRRVYDVLSELKKSTLRSYATKALRSDLDGKKPRDRKKRDTGVKKAMRRLTAKNADEIGALTNYPEVKKIASKVQDSYEPEGESLDELKMPSNPNNPKIKAAYKKGAERSAKKVRAKTKSADKLMGMAGDATEKGMATGEKKWMDAGKKAQDASSAVRKSAARDKARGIMRIKKAEG